MTKVPENGETTEFKSLFQTWEKPKLPGTAKPYTQNKIGKRIIKYLMSWIINYIIFSLIFCPLFVARTVQTKFDASMMHDNPSIAKETGMVDDGSGAKKVKA